MSSQKQVIVVIGSTGKQGGSVVKSLLNDPKTAERFQLRGITRNADSDKAKALKAKGVEVVAADLEDKASLVSAFKGAYGVFAVTNFWESLNPDTEEKQGRNIAEAAAETKVQHLVWSSLLNIKELSNGVLPDIHHFDAKARVEEYIKQLGVPATFFLAGYFYTNIVDFLLQPDEGGKSFSVYLPIPPTSPTPWFDSANDTGKFVKGIFLNRDKVLGKRIYGATTYTPIGDVVKETGKYLGKEVKYLEIPHDAYKKALGDGAGFTPVLQEEMLQNMRLLNEFGYYGGDSLDFSHSILDEKPNDLQTFLANSPEIAKLKG